VSQVSREQQRVLEHPLDAPAIVDAGAGTGKTHTIVNRVAYLHEHGLCAAKNILLLTFARKAAAELRRRTLERLGPAVEPPHCSTFHAFASSVLMEHAYDLGVSPDSTVIEDVDARLEFREAMDDVIYGDNVDAAALPLRSARRDELRAGLFAIAQWLKERDFDIEGFERRALREADLIAEIPYRSIRKRTKGGAVSKTVEASTTDDDLVRESEEARARVRAVGAIVRRYDERLQRRFALTYADLLRLARRGIADEPRLRDELRGRFLHCIVDEFQDTNDAQWRFLKTLFGDGLERVTVVGDPRQSIFSFIGATPENITKFAGIEGSRRYALSENRRSQQEILDLAHAVIARQTPDEAPLRAHRGAAGRPNVHVASRWATDKMPRPNADANRRAQATAVARRIAAMLARGGVKPDDIAILTRNKTQIQPFTAELVAHHIPFRLLGGAGFYETNEVRDALAWLTVLADPLDGQAVARLCESSSCGLSDAAMTTLAHDLERDTTAFSRRALVEPLPDALDDDSRRRLSRLRELVDAVEPYAAASLRIAFPKIFELTGVVDAYERAGDDQAVANLRKLARLASAFVDRNREAQARDFVRYIHELTRIDFDDREADPPATDAVSIMTIHAAKGLEWPIVFVIDVWPQNTQTPMIWLDSETGALVSTEGANGVKTFHAVAAKLQPDDEGIAPHKDELGESARDAEERRLFYVALTRARDELHVFGGSKYSKSSPLGKPHGFVAEVESWVQARGWPVDEPGTEDGVQLGRVNSTAPAVSRAHGRINPAAPFAAVAGNALPRLSFSTLHAYERCPRSVTYAAILHLPDLRRVGHMPSDDSLLEVIAVDGREEGTLLASDRGRLVHRALERWARARLAGGSIGTPESYVTDAASELGLSIAVRDFQRAIDDARLATTTLAAWRIERAEAPFVMQFGDAVIEGYIDLIARDPTGRQAVLDYKTGETAISEYALQLGIYREAARRAYRIEDAACVVGRFSDGAFALEALDVPSADAVRARIETVAAGLRAGSTEAKPGRWCFTCAYRAAPCDAYH